MRFTTPILAAAVAAAFLFSGAKPAQGQKKEDFVTLQREIYDLGRKLDEMKEGQDAKTGELQTLLQQLNATLSAEMQRLTEKVVSDQEEQRQSLSTPLGDVKRDVGDLSTGMLSLQTNISEINRRQDKMGTKVDDLELLLRTALSKIEEVAAKPAFVPPSPPGEEQAAQIAFASAYALRAEGKLAEALQAYIQLSQMYAASPYAPMAMYEVGDMYGQNGQWDQAVAAYDQVLEQFGENMMRAAAQFRKAEALEKLDRKTDAIREYENFAKQNPGDPKAQEAIERSAALKAPARGKGKGK